MSNPYMDEFDDDDADVLSDNDPSSAPKAAAGSFHTTDGSICPTCGVAHNVVMDEDIPQEVKDRLGEFLDSLPHENKTDPLIVTRGDSRAPELIYTFASLMKSLFENVDPLRPIVRALFEVVNMQSDGYLDVLADFFALESQIVIIGYLRNAVAEMIQGAEQKVDDPAFEDDKYMIQTFIQVLRSASESYEPEFNNVIETYKRSAEKIGKTPNVDALLAGELGHLEKKQYGLLSGGHYKFLERQAPQNSSEDTSEA